MSSSTIRAGLLALFAGGCGSEAAPAGDPGAGGGAQPAATRSGVGSEASLEAVAGGLRCAEPSTDFGEVWEGAVLEHSFEFGVEGAENTVSALRADCGCTLAELERQAAGSSAWEPYEKGSALEPGDRVRVDVTYDTRGKRGRAPRTITLYAREGAVPVEVWADVRPWLRLEPGVSDLGILRDEEEVSTVFRVRSSTGEPFALAHTGRAVPPEVVVTPRSVGGGERASEWEVDVLFGKGLPRGPHLYPIELVTDVLHAGSDRPIGTSPQVTIQVVGAVSLSPPTFDFGIVPPGELVSRTVRLVGHDPEFELPEPVLRFVPVRPELPSLVECATLSAQRVAGHAWDLRMTLGGLEGLVEGTLLGRLVVETGHPDEPVLEARVSFTVLPSALSQGMKRVQTEGSR